MGFGRLSAFRCTWPEDRGQNTDDRGQAAEAGRRGGWKADWRGSWEAIKLGSGRKIRRMLNNEQNYIRERRSPPFGA